MDASGAATSPQSNAPDSAAQKALAGAFIAIKTANKALALQPRLPAVTIKGLETVNDDLAVAQSHAAYWSDTLSQAVQKQLQTVVDYNTLYAALHGDIMEAITAIRESDHDNAPGRALINLHDFMGALQSQVQIILYGASGDKSNPENDSALGVYHAITAYHADVGNDAATFTGYKNVANSSESGIKAEIKQLQLDIDAAESALNKDRTMIAGGAAMAVTGILIIVVAVALAPETGGATIAAIGVLGAATVVGGVAMATVAAIDLANKQQDVVTKTAQIAADNQELASLSTIGSAANSIAAQAATIHGALETLVANWQQMENDLGEVIANLQRPEEELMAWIGDKTGQEPSYHTMGILLMAQFGPADKDWAAAASSAQTILTNLRSIVEFELPPASQHDVSHDTLMSRALTLQPAM